MTQAVQKLSLVLDASANPWVAFISIVLASFVLEDAATVLSAMAAADGQISVPVALFSLFCGIALGDFGLYALGRFAARHPKAQRWIEFDRVREVRAWIDGKLATTVIATRFLPGARLPTYTACGFLGLSFRRFALAVVLATAVWTTLLFAVFLSAGTLMVNYLGPWRWPAGIAVAVLVMLVGHWLSRWRARNGKGAETKEDPSR